MCTRLFQCNKDSVYSCVLIEKKQSEVVAVDQLLTQEMLFNDNHEQLDKPFMMFSCLLQDKKLYEMYGRRKT